MGDCPNKRKVLLAAPRGALRRQQQPNTVRGSAIHEFLVQGPLKTAKWSVYRYWRGGLDCGREQEQSIRLSIVSIRTVDGEILHGVMAEGLHSESKKARRLRALTNGTFRLHPITRVCRDRTKGEVANRTPQPSVASFSHVILNPATHRGKTIHNPRKFDIWRIYCIDKKTTVI